MSTQTTLFTHEGLTYSGPDILHQYRRLEDEIGTLRRWKEEMLLVESQWDAQEVGTLLGVALGKNIRPKIAEGIRDLQEDLEMVSRSREAWKNITQVVAHDAAFNQMMVERVRDLVGADSIGAIPTEINSLKIELVITHAVRDYLALKLDELQAEIHELSEIKITKRTCQTHKKRKGRRVKNRK